MVSGGFHVKQSVISLEFAFTVLAVVHLGIFVFAVFDYVPRLAEFTLWYLGICIGCFGHLPLTPLARLSIHQTLHSVHLFSHSPFYY